VDLRGRLEDSIARRDVHAELVPTPQDQHCQVITSNLSAKTWITVSSNHKQKRPARDLHDEGSSQAISQQSESVGQDLDITSNRGLLVELRPRSTVLTATWSKKLSKESLEEIIWQKLSKQ
jgi:hypothetical protein